MMENNLLKESDPSHKIAKVDAIVPVGPDGALVEVEGDISDGLPSFNLVGLASKTVNESRERVRSALKSEGFRFPLKRITISLAPAELSKDGPHLDLPIALAVLILANQLHEDDLKNSVFIGELSLEGRLRPVRGIINIVESAKKRGFKSIYIPKDNLNIAKLVTGIKIYGVDTLSELFQHLKNQMRIPHTKDATPPLAPENSSLNVATFTEIQGQARAKRALILAMAGGHNILLVGPPGSGKTMLSKAAADLLPPLSSQERIVTTKLHSLKLPCETVITRPPFRSPHHTSSVASVIGSGSSGNNIFPGEISLAHNGILFLDELPEFPRNILEALRQPLEDHEVTISRANQKITYPADFTLIATMNPCPCGYFGDKNHLCSCTDSQIHNYQKRISGPLLDRIDLYVEVKYESSKNLLSPKNTPTSKSDEQTMLDKLKTAIERQSHRKAKNSRLLISDLKQYANLDEPAKKLLELASDKLSLSTRSYLKTIRVARTIADLDDEDQIKESHIKEALSFRKT